MDILSALNKFLAYIFLIVPLSNGIVNNTFRGGVFVSQEGPLLDVISITAGQFFSNNCRTIFFYIPIYL